MRPKFLLLALASAVLLPFSTARAGENASETPPSGSLLSLVPLPVEVKPGQGEFPLDARTTISGEGRAGAEAAEMLASLLRQATGLSLPVENPAAASVFRWTPRWRPRSARKATC